MVAAVTYTATTGMTNSPRSNNGDNVVVFSKSLSAFHGTVGSAVVFCKVPNHAIVYDAAYACAGATAAVTATLLELQLGSTAIAATTSANQATAGYNRSGLLPLKVSLSDDAAVQYAILRLYCTTAGTASTSLSIAGYIAYSMDNNDPL
jgi:hypothetical protein